MLHTQLQGKELAYYPFRGYCISMSGNEENRMKEIMLLFDLDGTLWDSAAEVAESWNIVMQKHHPELPALSAADLNALMGKTMDEISGVVLPQLDKEERQALFKECEEFEVEYIKEHGGVLYPGVRETLKSLKEEGFSLAVVSNCQIGYIDAFFCSMNMKEFFCDSEEWGRTRRSKAENIRLVMKRNSFEKGIYIGDTIRDMEAAKGAGIPFIHASYGFGDIPDPDGRISKFEDLPDCLKRIISAF